MISLRTATHDDIPSLVAFAGLAFYEAYIEFDDPQEIHDYVSENLTADYFATAIASSDSQLEVLSDGNQLEGYLLMKSSIGPEFVPGSKHLELARIYLGAAQKGRGLGRLLIERVFAFAQDEGFDSIWLQVYDKNLAAIEFYRRFGFEQRGFLDFMFGGRVYKDPVMVATTQRAEHAR